MAANLSFVTHTAQRHPRHLTVQRLCHGCGDGGLTHAGRADQADDLPLQIGRHLFDRKELQNALFDLFHAEMVRIENLSGLRQIDALRRLDLPRQLQTDIQVVAQDSCLCGAEGLLGHAAQLFFQLFCGILRQVCLFDFFGILLNFIVAAVTFAKLLLDELQLFPQIILLLGLIHPVTHLGLDLPIQPHDLHFPAQNLINTFKPLARVQF